MTLNRRAFLTTTTVAAVVAAPAALARDGAEDELLAVHDEFLRMVRETEKYQPAISALHPKWVEAVKAQGGFDRNEGEAERLYRESGLHALMEAQAPFDDAAQRLAERIRLSPLTTPLALAMKASVIKHYSASHFWREPDDAADWDHLVTRQLLDQVIEAGGLSRAAA